MKSSLAAFLFLIVASTTSAWWIGSQGWTLYYGDAEAHLDIARRVVDSRTPGYDQIGTVWLPLPHIAMLPLVGHQDLWRNGQAGTIPSAIGFVFSGLFLFSATRRLLGSVPAAWAVLACYATNPNLLYLQSIPMSEAIFFGSLMALFYCTVAYSQAPSLGFVLGAGLASMAASLSRYEGWFLIPFLALFFLLTSRRILPVASFLLLASAAPAYWLAHNWWLNGSPLDFYNGPYSALAIQGGQSYPGQHDWALSWLYYRSTAQLCAGWGAVTLGLAGLVVALFRRLWWPLTFLALSPAFYVWSLHSSGTPIFIPTLWPNSYYNSRYGLSALPLLALGAGAAVLLFPKRWHPHAACAAALICLLPWLAHPRPDSWVCWKESQVNSNQRRAWTHEAAQFLKAGYRPGTGIVSKLSDLAGIYREAGIPFREILQEGNHPAWEAATANPDRFLHEEWAIANTGDAVSRLVQRSGKYRLIWRYPVRDGKDVEIYRRN